MKRLILIVITLIQIAILRLSAQGTAEDYRRAHELRGKYAGKVANTDVRVMPNRDDSGSLRYTVFDGDMTH